YRARQLYGDRPPLDSYQERFPGQYERLRELVQKRPVPAAAVPTAPPAEERTYAGRGGHAAGPPTGVLPVAGGYTLLEFIDEGEYGEVYRALAPGGVEVAIKRVFRPTTHESSQREQLALELIKSLRHPFLLQTQAYWTEQDRLCIVME